MSIIKNNNKSFWWLTDVGLSVCRFVCCLLDAEKFLGAAARRSKKSCEKNLFCVFFQDPLLMMSTQCSNKLPS